jgi:hypothetical protein
MSLEIVTTEEVLSTDFTIKPLRNPVLESVAPSAGIALVAMFLVPFQIFLYPSSRPFSGLGLQLFSRKIVIATRTLNQGAV